MEWWLLQDVLDCEVYMAWKGDLTNTCRKDTLVTIKYRNTTSDWKRSWTLKVFLHMKYHFTCSLFMLPPTNICNWLLGAALYHYNSIWSKYSEIIYIMLGLFNDIQRHSPLAQSLDQHNPVTSGGSCPAYATINDCIPGAVYSKHKWSSAELQSILWSTVFSPQPLLVVSVTNHCLCQHRNT